MVLYVSVHQRVYALPTMCPFLLFVGELLHADVELGLACGQQAHQAQCDPGQLAALQQERVRERSAQLQRQQLVMAYVLPTWLFTQVWGGQGSSRMCRHKVGVKGQCKLAKVFG